MDTKDYIYVYDKKGKKQKMELVLVVKKPDEDYNYIIYKEPNKKIPLYMAKFKVKEGINSLQTDLIDEEKDILINILKKDLLESK